MSLMLTTWLTVFVLTTIFCSGERLLGVGLFCNSKFFIVNDS